MIYKKFYFKNYKGIKETSIEFDNHSNLCCIVGINESGKTTILKAIETTFFLLKKDKNKIEEIADKLESKIKPKISNFTGDIVLGCVLSLTDKNKKELKIKDEEIEISFTFHIEKAKWLDRKYITKIVSSNTKRIEKETEIVDYLSINAPKVWLYNDFLEKIPDNIIFYRRNRLPQGKSDEEFTKEVNQKWMALLDDVGRNCGVNGFDTFQNQIIDWKINNPLSTNDEDVLADINRKIDEEITNKWTEFYGKKTISSIKVDVSNTDEKYIVKIKVFGIDGKPYQMEDRSLGFRWYFSFLFFTLFRKSDDALFLIDEPASNLYSVAQEGILKRLKDLAMSNQVIYTTHSPYLLDSDSCISGFLATNTDTEKGNEANIILHSLSQINIASKEWVEYTKTLQDFNVLNLPKCYLYENNLFVEGFEDWVLIRVFCDKMLNKLQNVSIIYGNGAGSMDNEIKYSICYRKKFLLILDNDKGGKDGIKHYEKNFQLFNVNNNIKKLNDLINDNNITTIQSLIAEEDKKIICKLCNIEYNKKNKILIINACKNIYQHYYMYNNNKIIEQLNQQLSQQTKDNFTKLADAIEKHFNLK